VDSLLSSAEEREPTPGGSFERLKMGHGRLGYGSGRVFSDDEVQLGLGRRHHGEEGDGEEARRLRAMRRRRWGESTRKSRKRAAAGRTTAGGVISKRQEQASLDPAVLWRETDLETL
jgi:hypothetical protein